MILALLILLTSNPRDSHIGFCQYGCPVGCLSWCPSKIDKVCYGQHLGQFWCFLEKSEPNISYNAITSLTRSWNGGMSEAE